MDQYFWLFCGVWCGLLGGFYLYFRLQRHITSGELLKAEVMAFCRGLALWILIPCVLLWLLQESAAGQVPPDYLKWPPIQRSAAISLQAFVWGALLYWVFARQGAELLSRYARAMRSSASALYGPTTFKIGAIAVVMVGAAALLSQLA